MAARHFIQLLSIARAVLFFDTALAGNALLTARTFSNTSSPTITSPPSTKTYPPIKWCQQDGVYWANCANNARAYDYADEYQGQILGFVDPDFQPYNSEIYPSNIVPPNPSIASYCGSLWNSSVAEFMATGSITTASDFGAWTDTYTVYVDTFTWIPTVTECCLQCTITAGDVSVMVWPSPPISSVTTLVDTSANFTFISPSVYVAFGSIQATNLCGVKGSAVYSTTVALDADQLSTQRFYFPATTGSLTGDDYELNNGYCAELTSPEGEWSTFDYGSCGDIKTSWWTYYGSNDTTKYSDASAFNADLTSAMNECGLGCEGVPISSLTCVYNPCSPFLSVPSQVASLNPALAGCDDEINVYFDPPYTLSAGNGLVAFSTTPYSGMPASPAATPQPAIGSPTASPTEPKPAPVVPTASSSSVAVDSKPSESSSSSDPAEPSESATGDPDPPASPAAGTSSPSVAADPGEPVTVDPSHQATVPAQASSPSVPVDPIKSDTVPAVDPGSSAQAPANPSVSSQASSDPRPASQDSPDPLSSGDPATPQAGYNPVTSQPIATIGDLTASQVSSHIIIGDSTLSAGGDGVTIGGTTFSLNPSTSLVVDGSTTALAFPKLGPSLVTISSTILAIVGSQTIAPGSVATIDGKTYSLATSGNALIVDGSTTALALPTPIPSLVTTSSATLVVVGSQTIVPGSAATIDGKTYSLATDGNALVVDGTSQYFVGSQTLVAGGSAIIVSGTVLSLASGGQSVVVGSSTQAIGSFFGTTSTGLGGAIMSIGGFNSESGGTSAIATATATGYNGTVFTGSASRRSGIGNIEIVGWAVSLVICNQFLRLLP